MKFSDVLYDANIPNIDVPPGILSSKEKKSPTEKSIFDNLE